jgi:hypothetical protein
LTDKKENEVANITKRLDAILGLLIILIRTSDPNTRYADVAKVLSKSGLTQPEIAKVLGWKSTGSVRNLLKNRGNKSGNSDLK